MVRRSWLMAGLMALLLLAGAACSDDDANEAATPDTVSPTASTRLAVEIKDLSFSPDEITVRAGETVEFTFQNSGNMLHDFTIDDIEADVIDRMGGDAPHTGMDQGGQSADPALHMAMDAGEDGMMTVRFTNPGTYIFYCTVDGHREAGMQGMLNVH